MSGLERVDGLEPTPGPERKDGLERKNGLERKEKARLIVEASLALKAENPTILDVREVTAFADTFVIVSGRSERQVRSISEAIEKVLREAGEPPLGVEGKDRAHWVLMDCNDVIVHIFAPGIRDEYALERLWSDAEPLDLGIPQIEAAEA